MSKLAQTLPVELGSEQLPTYVFPENAARALGKITAYARWRRRDPGLLWGFDDLHVADARTICRTALERRGEGWLSHEETARVLAAFGLPAATGAVAHTEDEAAALATAMKFPVVAKLSSNQITHKSDIGAVKLNLVDEPAVRSAHKEILAAARAAVSSDADGVLIQPMIAGGVETMVGVTQDPVFGPLVAFGLGGVYVEILKDVVFRIAPLTDRDVDELLHGIKGFPLLEGYRGHPPADLEALRELLLRISSLAKEIPEISELDLNPVIALPPGRGCCIVDARIRVKATTISTDRRRR